jgi:hypothetical protein
MDLEESQIKPKVHMLEDYYNHALKALMTSNTYNATEKVGRNDDLDNMDIKVSFCQWKYCYCLN